MRRYLSLFVLGTFAMLLFVGIGAAIVALIGGIGGWEELTVASGKVSGTAALLFFAFMVIMGKIPRQIWISDPAETAEISGDDPERKR